MNQVFLIAPRPVVVSAFAEQDMRVVRIIKASDRSAEEEPCETLIVDDVTHPLQVVDALAGSGVNFGDDSTICIGLGDATSMTGVAVNILMGIGKNKFPSISSLQIMKNKPSMRSLLAEKLPRHTGFYAVVDSLLDLRGLLSNMPGGVVVKPVDGSGSRSVFRLRSVQELEAAAPKLSFPTLVEEMFYGPEFSVEMISMYGKHQPLAVTQKILGGQSGVVETGQIQPAPIPNEQRDLLFRATMQLLDAVGFTYGLSHTEIILQDGVPKIVETHGRVGGDRIADMLRFTTGYNAFERFACAVQSDSFLPIRPRADHARADFYDLRDYCGSDEEWLSEMRASSQIVEAKILKPQQERGAIWCSADRHALTVSVFGRTDAS